jgi:hypothetical protein
MAHRFGNRWQIIRIYQLSSTTTGLGQSATVRGNYSATGSHRFESNEPKRFLRT